MQSHAVRRFNLYSLRILFALIFLFVGSDAWMALLTHQGPWKPVPAAAVSMWASYALLSIIGVFRPLKMLPILLFVILYKLVWLGFVSLPLWLAGQLWTSPAAEMTKVFLWVPLAIVAVPWRYVVDSYVLGRTVE